MGCPESGWVFVLYSAILINHATVVSGIFDSPYIGSPKAPRNLLKPTPGKDNFPVRHLITKESGKAPASEWRLPTALKPIHYVVRLQPIIGGNFSILGHVEIEIEVVETTTNVTLNMYAIDALEQSIKVEPAGGGAGVGIQSTSFDAIREFYTVQLDEALSVGQNYVFSMDFEGFLDTTGLGFYRGSYVNDIGDTV
ncbi:hypothetical protein SK128_000557 [Halocaridina rubra]|uniref:Aminopeptidase N-like N-terminal domain-containing protein n=1 Tax=Halocaridina rubra TaxID=373956 RepID=A0AAN8WUN8_HALRR